MLSVGGDSPCSTSSASKEQPADGDTFVNTANPKNAPTRVHQVTISVNSPAAQAAATPGVGCDTTLFTGGQRSFNGRFHDGQKHTNHYAGWRLLLVPGIIFVENVLINQQDRVLSKKFCQIFGKCWPVVTPKAFIRWAAFHPCRRRQVTICAPIPQKGRAWLTRR